MKKTMGVTRWMISVGLIFAAYSALAVDVTSRAIFEVKYQAWKTWVSEHQTLSTYVWNQPYAEIVTLGPSVIPYIIEKIETVPEDFHLSSAIRRITKKDFSKEEWPTDAVGDSISAAKMYLVWWKEDRFKTGEHFADLHSKRKLLKLGKKDKEAQDTYQKIVDLGIPALPYLIEQVEQQPEFVSAISRLSGGALPPTATATDCKQWWGKNKQKFELPSQSESEKSSEKK